jgi:hypothetical protein
MQAVTYLIKGQTVHSMYQNVFHHIRALPKPVFNMDKEKQAFFDPQDLLHICESKTN